MRSIAGKEEKAIEEAKRGRRNKIVGLFLLLIMVVSSIGYAFLSGDEQASGSGNQDGTLYEQNGMWIGSFGQNQVAFSSSPESVKNVSVDVNVTLNDYYQEPLYYVDESNGIYSELSYSLLPFLLRIQPACLNNCTIDAPIKNCSGLDNIIVWDKTKTENKVYQNDNCVIMEGDIKAVDAFLYYLFGLN
ncbi:MAG: hypothetical protein AABX11_00185 [Nanoarchaeota archaeon]